MLDATIAKIAQKRIPCAQRQKSESWTIAILRFREKPRYYFKRSPIATDGNKLSIALVVSTPSQFRRMPESSSFDGINFDSARSQPIKRWSDKLPAPSTASRRIHYGDECLIIHGFARVGPDAPSAAGERSSPVRHRTTR